MENLFNMIYYHNPRCRKSRDGINFLKEKNIYPEIREYLKEPLSFDDLKSILNKLGIRPEELIRKNEEIYKTEIKGKKLTEKQLIAKMIDFPKLIERPILENGDKAAVGRPAENFLSILD